MSPGPFGRIRKLDAGDDCASFDCGRAELNLYLQRYAEINQRTHGAQTYVSCIGRVVAGYYCLAVGGVSPEDAPARVAKGLARHPIPVMLLARLAVDLRHQGQGLGRALLRDALLRTVQAADIAGIRALLVHAKDEPARRWYAAHDFEPSPADPFHLFLLMKDIEEALR
jgi:GNAT superfamily N-acetyltransferase